MSRYWKVLPAIVFPGSATIGTAVVELPLTTTPYYISGSAVDADGFVTSTPLVRVAPREIGLTNLSRDLDYDGMSEWGGFEPHHVDYMARHGHMPGGTVSAEAKDGEQSFQLNAGPTRIPFVWFTDGIPHRLTCYLKSGQPVEVAVGLHGTFDGKPHQAEAKAQVGTDWTEVTLDFTPPQAIAAGLSLHVTVPEGATVLIDEASLRPVAQE